jgi:hypothetical protein
MPPWQAGFFQGHASRLRLSDRKQQDFLLTTVLVAVGKEAMSYRELSMIDVKELLRRWSAGHSNRKIARETGADRATVRRYFEVVRELGLECGHELSDAEVHDTRFEAVQLPELDTLKIDVTVLHRPRSVRGPEDLDPKRYGVVVRDGHGRQGILLPDLQGIDDVATQLSVARRKAGIAPEAPVLLQRFAALRFHEQR